MIDKRRSVAKRGLSDGAQFVLCTLGMLAAGGVYLAAGGHSDALVPLAVAFGAGLALLVLVFVVPPAVKYGWVVLREHPVLLGVLASALVVGGGVWFLTGPLGMPAWGLVVLWAVWATRKR